MSGGVWMVRGCLDGEGVSGGVWMVRGCLDGEGVSGR